MRALLAGPVKDPNRNRTVKACAVHVEGSSLRMTLDDGTHARLTFENPLDMITLAAQLLMPHAK